MTVPEESGFDPDYKWLGIPPSEQPPNLYRLLGLGLYENDPEVIAAAADRQMAHVKAFASGPHSQASQELLTRLAKARITLLNTQEKKVYDSQLRKVLAHAGDNRSTDLFDPYHQWLSIPPIEQPPNYYRLLGLEKFEQDTQVIFQAAERQLNYVETYLESDRAAEAEIMLRELEAAKKTFLDPQAKEAYDKWLRKRETKHTRPAAVGGAQRAVSMDTPTARVLPAAPIVVTRTTKKRAKSRLTLGSFLLALLAPVIGVSMGYLVLCGINPDNDVLGLLTSLAGETHNRKDVAIPQQDESDQKAAEEQKNTRHLTEKEKQVPIENADNDQTTIAVPAVVSGIPGTADQPVSVRKVSLPDAGDLAPKFLVPVPMQTNSETSLTVVPGTSVEGNGVLTCEMQEAERPQWKVSWQAETEAVQDGAPALVEPVPVAHLAIIDDQLAFRWAENGGSVPQDCIRNSILKLESNAENIHVHLRTPEVSPEKQFSLRSDVFRLQCKTLFMPAQEDLRFVAKFDDFPVTYTQRGRSPVLAVGEQHSLEYVGYPNVVTTCAVHMPGRVPVLRLATSYRLPSGTTEPMSIDGATRIVRLIERKLSKARAAEKVLIQARDKLSALNNRLLRSTNTLERSNNRALVTAAEQDVAAAEAMVDAIPGLREDYQFMLGIGELAQQLNDGPKISVHMYQVLGRDREEKVDLLVPAAEYGALLNGEDNQSPASSSNLKQDAQVGEFVRKGSNERYSLVSISTINDGFIEDKVRLEWKIVVKNEIDGVVNLFGTIKWLNENEKIVATQKVRPITLDGHERREITGQYLVDVIAASRIAAVQADVKEGP